MESPKVMQLPSVLGGLGSIALKANSLFSTTHFSNNTNSIDNMTTEQGFLFFIFLIILIYLTMWFGAFVFNTSIVKIFPSTKRVTTLDFFGLYIVIHLLFC
jgi:hypothetical protein